MKKEGGNPFFLEKKEAGMFSMEMEEVSCPICGSSDREPLHREGPFQMSACRICRLIYLSPRPSEESVLRFYQDYLPRDESAIESWKAMMAPVFRRAAGLLDRHGKGGRLLDVGTGFGFFLAEMKDRGWDVAGVEISEKALCYAQEALGLTMFRGPLEKVGFSENEFDVVTGFYLIEHLPDPIAFLKECHRILRPGGFLLLRYPHTTPIKNMLRLLGIKNRLYDLPAHLSDFAPGMIQQSLEKAGFGKCRHWIGGHTLPRDLGKRIASSSFGTLSELLFYLTLKRFLLPGVSKTVIAYKGNKR